MNLEGQPWTTDSHIAAALDNFPFFWVLGRVVFFLFVLLLTFSEFWGRGLGCSFLLRAAYHPRSVPGLVWVFGPLYLAKDTFSKFLGRIWGGFANSILPTPPAQFRG